MSLKNKGFTIIELIIAMVIIGVLSALVAMSYSGITAYFRKASFQTNTETILKKMNIKESDGVGFNPLSLTETNLTNELNIDDANYETLAVYKQNKENYARILGKEKFEGLIACGTSGNVTVYDEEFESCVLGGSGNYVARVVDTTPGVLGGGNGSTCALAKTIDSIEDLVWFSNSVNTGTTYSGLCVKLTIDLDFVQSKSYVNKDTTTFGDVNGDTIIESLKTELTTGAGFMPIGNSTNYFRGTFDGTVHNIYNLFINRPATDYVALFGKNSGVIRSLKITDAVVTGRNWTSALLGMNTNGQIFGCEIIGNITGSNYVGLVVGEFSVNSGKMLSSTKASGNVTGTDHVAGIAGRTYNPDLAATTTSSIYAYYGGGAISATGTNKNRIVGSQGREYAARPYIRINSLALGSSTVNNVTINSTDATSFNGANIDNSSELNEINLAETVFDTYIGGDNDADGYYWDYDESNNVVRRDVATYPLTFSLSGAGTIGDPYLIGSYADLRQAALKPTSSFKLTASINLTGQKFYMLGSYCNAFTGNIDGNDKTISNLTINAPRASHVGLVGFGSNGLIRHLNITNANITASQNVGILVGYSSHINMFDNNIGGNVTATNKAGLVVGQFLADTDDKMTSTTANGNITGVDYIGGIVGYTLYTENSGSSYNIVSAIYSGGSVVATGSNKNRIVGGQERSYIAVPYVRIGSLALSTTTVNGSNVVSSYATSFNGATINNLSELNEINLAETVFDTYIGGDNDADGYYWDYDGSNNVVRRDVATYPLTFSLSGAGTPADPYLIGSYANLRQAALRPGSSYKLTADIDLSGQKFYSLGSYSNNFTGSFDGNDKTISNLTINAPHASYVGIIGYAVGGTIKGVNTQGASITAGNYSSILAGYTWNVIIKDNAIGGNLVGLDNTGLIAGYFATAGPQSILSVTASGNVTGASSVGGIVGHTYNSEISGTTVSCIKGVYISGSITATGSNINRIVGGRSKDYAGAPYVPVNAYSLSSIPINGSAVVSSLATSLHGADAIASDLSTSTIYTNAGFNFTDEVLDYVWYISGPTAVFREGTL